MLKLLYWVLAPIAAAGRLAARIRNWADRKWWDKNALRPGSPVALKCQCHLGQVWYVEAFNYEAGDYKLVATWPGPDSDSRSIDVNYMYIRDDKFTPVAGASPDVGLIPVEHRLEL